MEGDPLRPAPYTRAPGYSPSTEDPAGRDLVAVDAYVEVEATWGIYQRMIAAYREADR